MAKKQLVTKVWIEPGCIICDACETTAPDVFEVQHENDTCVIRPAALDAEFNKPRTKAIIDAAEECPVDVIKFDTIEIEVSDAEAAADAAKAPAAASAAGAGAAAAKLEPPKPKEVDPAIQALLAATTVRGGHVVLDRGLEDMPESVRRMAKLSPSELPPDARQAKVLDKSKADTKKEPEGASRRDILGVAGMAAGWAAVATVTGGGTLAFARFMAPNVLEVEDPKVRCGPLSKYVAMAPGDVNEDYKPVKPSGFWIIRQEDRIAALSIICTHLGCIPSWLPNDRKFKCPCHGSGFKENGVNFEGPAPRPLERFKIYLDGDEVIVDRSRKFLAMGPSDTAVWNDPEAYIPV
ncbi:MAG: Rieske 2Fe-2S domain-containing protein [Phycisphaerales bacterium]|nr:Rieske 2Fe-2S domain-containing protein [Phycisphaerales bacterium]MCB9854261.1 Rieske 2Fe-2S domain-containing protein [Phycisphaerales bacterium]MCB9864731.1 Rieske 2Fe-2S domain-containing protein [Phycisphaerales bacterium]